MATAQVRELEERLNTLERWQAGADVQIKALEKLDNKVEIIRAEVANIKGTQKLAIGAVIAIQFFATLLIALFKGFKP